MSLIATLNYKNPFFIPRYKFNFAPFLRNTNSLASSSQQNDCNGSPVSGLPSLPVDAEALHAIAYRVKRISSITYKSRESIFFDFSRQHVLPKGPTSTTNLRIPQDAAGTNTVSSLHAVQLHLMNVLDRLRCTPANARVTLLLESVQDKRWKNIENALAFSRNVASSHPLPIGYITTVLQYFVQLLCLCFDRVPSASPGCNRQHHCHAERTTSPALQRLAGYTQESIRCIVSEFGNACNPLFQRLLSRTQDVDYTSILTALQLLAFFSQTEIYLDSMQTPDVKKPLFSFILDETLDRLVRCLRNTVCTSQGRLNAPQIITLLSTVVLTPESEERTRILAWITKTLMSPEISKELMTNKQYGELITQKILPDALTLWNTREGAAALTQPTETISNDRSDIIHERSFWLKLYQLMPSIWLRRLVDALDDSICPSPSRAFTQIPLSEGLQGFTHCCQPEVAALRKQLLLSCQIVSLIENGASEFSLRDLTVILTAYSRICSEPHITPWDKNRLHSLMISLGNQAVRRVIFCKESAAKKLHTSVGKRFLIGITQLTESFSRAHLLHQDFFILLSKQLLVHPKLTRGFPPQYLVRICLAQSELSLPFTEEAKRRIMCLSTIDSLASLGLSDLACYALLCLHPQWHNSKLSSSAMTRSLLRAINVRLSHLPSSSVVSDFTVTPNSLRPRFLQKWVIYTYIMHFCITVYSAAISQRLQFDESDPDNLLMITDCQELISSTVPLLAESFGLKSVPQEEYAQLQILEDMRLSQFDILESINPSACRLLLSCVKWLNQHLSAILDQLGHCRHPTNELKNVAFQNIKIST